MINEKQAQKYCCEDISIIENYNRAVADQTQTWICHHRRGLEELSTEELKENGLYTKRPASELIFVTLSEHASIHNSGENHPMFGKHHTDEAREKMRQSHLGEKNHNYGNHLSEAQREYLHQINSGENHPCYGTHRSDATKEILRQKNLGPNNPMYGKRGEDSPNYGKTGERCSVYNTHWFNNGSICVRTRECPPGFVPGRLVKHKNPVAA